MLPSALDNNASDFSIPISYVVNCCALTTFSRWHTRSETQYGSLMKLPTYKGITGSPINMRMGIGQPSSESQGGATWRHRGPLCLLTPTSPTAFLPRCPYFLKLMLFQLMYIDIFHCFFERKHQSKYILIKIFFYFMTWLRILDTQTCHGEGISVWSNQNWGYPKKNQCDL